MVLRTALHDGKQHFVAVKLDPLSICEHSQALRTLACGCCTSSWAVSLPEANDLCHVIAHDQWHATPGSHWPATAPCCMPCLEWLLFVCTTDCHGCLSCQSHVFSGISA